MKDLRTILVLGLGVLAASVQAQINLPALSYSQNFDALGSASATWTDNSTINGWYASVSNATAGTVGPYTTAYSVGSGGGTSSSTLYALGIAASSERALGGAPSSTALGLLGMRLLNTSGGAFNDLQLKFDLEQWSDRGTANIGLSYQIFSPGGGNLGTLGGWTSLGSVASPLSVNATPVTGIGNTTGLLANNTFGLSSLNWQSGDELWFKWTISKISGQNSTHGIDNVVVAVPEPSVFALAGLGLLLGVNRLRRGR
jgi:hypothetical protein